MNTIGKGVFYILNLGTMYMWTSIRQKGTSAIVIMSSLLEVGWNEVSLLFVTEKFVFQWKDSLARAHLS
jgi:hypothetical protein